MTTALLAPAPPEQQRLSLTPQRLLPGHRVRLLFGGVEAYPAMLDAIATARTEIALETYIWASDANGRRFVDAVCIKAQEGVRVRCVIDGAGSFGFSGADVARMRAAGVLLSIFHPVGPWRARWGWQVRDHRKLLIVDGRVAFAGGMNLGDDYAPKAWGGHGWNDVHMQVEGPVLRDIRRLFEETWIYATPENWNPDEALPAPGASTEIVPVHGSTTRVQALAVGRFLARRSVQHHFEHAMLAARHRIWIEAAYFIPNRALRGALKHAARRGVDVRVTVPRYSDIPGLTHASQYTWASLLKSGVAIYEWLPGMLHGKTLTIDGAWSAVGSYNLDSRSLLYNWEIALEVLDERVAEQLDQKFRDDLEFCEKVDPALWKKRSLWQRLRERFFYVFRTWL
ncbi:MAG TPA: phospholipase D-like domain-containing protein [Myxococcales bacterium]|nr:phospholipase D-like domain-containing protein [Myxococcales bacterium]